MQSRDKIGRLLHSIYVVNNTFQVRTIDLVKKQVILFLSDHNILCSKLNSEKWFLNHVLVFTFSFNSIKRLVVLSVIASTLARSMSLTFTRACSVPRLLVTNLSICYRYSTQEQKVQPIAESAVRPSVCSGPCSFSHSVHR